jgi:hypothetical protein
MVALRTAMKRGLLSIAAREPRLSGGRGWYARQETRSHVLGANGLRESRERSGCLLSLPMLECKRLFLELEVIDNGAVPN